MLYLAEHAAGEPHLFGWYLGFIITTAIILVVVVIVQAILTIARRISLQAQQALEGLQMAYDNTRPLFDLDQTIGHAKAVVTNLLAVRKAAGG